MSCPSIPPSNWPWRSPISLGLVRLRLPMGEPINQISVTQCFDRVDAHFESLIVPGEWQGVAGRDLHTARKLGAELVAISLRLRQILSTTGESDGRSSNAMNIALSAGAAMATARADRKSTRLNSSHYCAARKASTS